ncbi:MAG: VWA domain-containing protein [Desulfohalobiaceae bacterium]|nr:VWA domain-containing protein [Desulfohalobiaceae bacterium]
MSFTESFWKEHPEIAASVSTEARDACKQMESTFTHLRPRKIRALIAEMARALCRVDKHPKRTSMLEGACRLCQRNWAMAVPYLSAAAAVAENRERLDDWSELAHDLASHDVDVAVAFLENTPQAAERFGFDRLLEWGQQALNALIENTTQMWPAVKAYIVESVADRCDYPLERWRFFLEQAQTVAPRSPAAAEAFIRLGNRMCFMLDAEGTTRWVQTGLEECRTEEELVNFFSGISFRSLERRDGFASGQSLKGCANKLSLLCEALLGWPVKIRANTTLAGRKGFTGGAATDGHAIFLPEVAYDFGLFKLMALHQAMLLERNPMLSEGGRMNFDPVAVHTDADRRLLAALPGLCRDMADRFPEGARMGAYPECLDDGVPVPLAWWGDLLPELVSETRSTLDRLKQKAQEQHQDVPPELVEKLLTSMMADGNREDDALWKIFEEMLETMLLGSPDPEALEENVKTFWYKEWDDNQSDYKMDWCLVRQRPVPDDANSFVADVSDRLQGMIRLIRRQFMRLKPERFKKYRAQPMGEALDIDALVEAFTDMHSDGFLSENIYTRRDKRIRDVAVLFLVDLSASTEEKIDGRRVIDVQKEAMVLMAEALDALQDSFAVYGFCSEGRFRVDMFSIKEFGETYDDTIRHRLGNLHPAGLTRMGTVIRHGLYKLESVSAVIKLMIILTDGRPYDLEYGYLDYAIADTRKAVQEARRKGVHPFIITSDQQGENYLRRISPQSGSIILRRIEQLPTLLPAVYKRLTV